MLLDAVISRSRKHKPICLKKYVRRLQSPHHSLEPWSNLLVTKKLDQRDPKQTLVIGWSGEFRRNVFREKHHPSCLVFFDWLEQPLLVAVRQENRPLNLAMDNSDNFNCIMSPTMTLAIGSILYHRPFLCLLCRINESLRP